MKILHVLAQLPMKTGSGVYFTNMVEGFKKYGHTQKVIFANQDEHEWNILEEKDIYPIVFKSEEIPFPIVGMSDVMPYDNTLYSSMDQEMINIWIDAFKKRLIQLKEEYNPDVIFSHHLWMLTSLVREVFSDTKVIGVCHNTDIRQAKINPILKAEYTKNLDKLDLVFSASEMQKDEIESVYGILKDKIVAVGGGYNQNIFYYPTKKASNEIIKLVFCAKIDPSKGIYELIEVYKSLGLDDVTLDIIGNPINENIDKINAYIKDDDTINLYNVGNQIALGDEFRKKHIFLMPSYYEGLGLTAIEALACSLYVVTTEIEALMSLLGDDIEKSGIVKYVSLPRIYDTDKPVEEDLFEFKENLRHAILEQIEKVRMNDNAHIKMKSKISTFSWQGIIEKMNQIIESK